MHRNSTITLILLHLSVIFCAVSGGDERGVQVRATGYATAPSYVVKQTALENAIKNGFEEYLLSIVPVKYIKYLQGILNKSSKYIISMKIVNESLTKDTCSIEVEIELDDESINRDVATFIMPYLEDLPTVLIMRVKEENLDNLDASWIDECVKLLIGKLENLKFNVATDGRLSERIRDYFQRDKLKEIETKKFFSVATDYDIVVIITPDIITEKINPQSDFVNYKGRAHIEIFRGYDGKLLDAFTSSSIVSSYLPQEGIKQAFEDAFIKAVPRIVSSSILGFLNVKDDKALIIKLEGFEDQKIVDTLIVYLENICYGCKLETLCVLPGLSKIKLYYDGPTVYIVDSLMSSPEIRSKINIRKVVDRKIEIVPFK